MDGATLQVTARRCPGEGLLLSADGYLDGDGAQAIARETRSMPATGPRRVRIDLGEVRLFNCSGVRQLMTLLSDLDDLGYQVDLIGVHPPLQRLLDLCA
jgi:anti-anti-sigma factor